MYQLPQRYGLADEALEDAIYDSKALRDFVGIDFPPDPVPEVTTLLKFRRLLLAGDLTNAMFEEINAHLHQRGLLMGAGKVVDGAIIAEATSAKNISGERGAEMHQAKKGSRSDIGMKGHIGVDAESRLVLNLVSTAATVNNVEPGRRLAAPARD
jgi:IS5 family transposase